MLYNSTIIFLSFLSQYFPFLAVFLHHFLSIFNLPETGFGVVLNVGPFLTVLGNTDLGQAPAG